MEESENLYVCCIFFGNSPIPPRKQPKKKRYHKYLAGEKVKLLVSFTETNDDKNNGVGSLRPEEFATFFVKLISRLSNMGNQRGGNIQCLLLETKWQGPGVL